MAQRWNLERSFESIAAAPSEPHVQPARHCTEKLRILLDADHLWSVPKATDGAVHAWAQQQGWERALVCLPHEVVGCGDTAELRLFNLDHKQKEAQASHSALIMDISAYTPALIRPLRRGVDAVLCRPHVQMIPLESSMASMLIGWRQAHVHDSHKHPDAGAREKLRSVACHRPKTELNTGLHPGHTSTTALPTEGSFHQEAHRLDDHVYCMKDDTDTSAIDLACATLTMRMYARSTHALSLARYLDAHPAVQRVSYPGLVDHPDHHYAHQFLTQGYGPALLLCLSASQAQLSQALSCSPFIVSNLPEESETSTDMMPCSSGYDTLQGAPQELAAQKEPGSLARATYLTRISHLATQSTAQHQVLMVEPGFESVPDVISAWEHLLNQLR